MNFLHLLRLLGHSLQMGAFLQGSGNASTVHVVEHKSPYLVSAPVTTHTGCGSLHVQVCIL